MLLLFSSKLSARCNYVFDLIFMQELGIEYRTTTDVTEFKGYTEEKINYSDSRIGDEFFIKASSLLFEREIKKQEIKVDEKFGTKILFANDEDDSGFDIFSSVFYLVSRYEEYLPFSADEFGRFPAKESFAFKNNFLEKPVVNIWIRIFKNLLQKKYPALVIRSAKFDALLTYDIDVAFKFKGRSVGRTIGSCAKDLSSLNFENIKERFQTLLKRKKDPWNVYDDLQKIISQNELRSVFFFLLADRGKHDRNLHYNNPEMKSLILQIQSFSDIGIHPSFTTSDFPKKVSIEKKRLESLSGIKITKSRQHYLKLIFPDTYHSLLSAGITEDYSMGFADAPGFRAGTCEPFYFYDLKNEKATSLKIYPITFMEGTLMKTLEPIKALQKIKRLLEEVKNVNGLFISLWHNHTISQTDEYKEWKNIHDKMIGTIVTMRDAS